MEDDRPGTTNVDFGDAMRVALARLSHESEAQIAVDAEQVVLEADGDQVIERVVPLPASWLRGFTETQVLASQAEHGFSLDRAQATRALQALTRLDARTAAHVRPTPTGVRVSTRSTVDSVPIAGGGRLKALSALAPRLHGLDAWRHPSGACAWVLDLGSHRLTWMLSPALQRGFSGEGASLELAAPEVGAPALRGNVGWDFALGDWFPRVLPWAADAQARVHPRERRARRLVESGAVTLVDADVAEVRTRGGVHRVRSGSRRHCTCTWVAKHGLDRGPCAHLLAVEQMRTRA